MPSHGLTRLAFRMRVRRLARGTSHLIHRETPLVTKGLAPMRDNQKSCRAALRMLRTDPVTKAFPESRISKSCGQAIYGRGSRIAAIAGAPGVTRRKDQATAPARFQPRARLP